VNAACMVGPPPQNELERLWDEPVHTPVAVLVTIMQLLWRVSDVLTVSSSDDAEADWSHSAVSTILGRFFRLTIH
jgi:hypothetical protein